MIVNTIGPPGASIMLVGEAPGEQEDRTGKPFEGSAPAGRTLNKILESAGISRHECLITNVARERPPGNKIGFYFTDAKCTSPKPILTQWIQKLKEEIEFYQPNIVVALGKIATQTLVAGSDSITNTRGYIYNSTLVPGQKVISTYHPQKINYEWKLLFTAVMDIRKAVKNSKTRELPVDDRVLITNMSKVEYIDYLQFLLYSHKDPIAVDIETLQPGSHIHTLGIADSPKHAVSFEFLKGRTPVYSESKELEIWQYLTKVFTAKELIMQNGSYDTGVLYYNNGIYCPKYNYDTLIAAHICWPESPRSLQYLASICLNVPAWKQTNESSPLLYNASDAANTYGVWNVLEAELIKQDNLKIFQYEMAQVEPSVMLQLQGMKVNTKVQKELQKEIDSELEEVKERLSTALNREVIFKADKTKKDAININSSQQLANLLYIDLGIKEQYKRRGSINEVRKVTTDEEALSKLARTIDNPIFTDVIKVKKLTKMRTFIDIELSPEGKVHTSYNVTGATMAIQKKGFVIDEEDSFKSFARWSSSKSIILPFGNGNLQNVPKYARKMYTAPEGFEIIQADYIQAEAVVVAYEIGDSRTIALFKESFGLSREEKKNKNYDVHKLSASVMFGLLIEEITPEMRTIGKVIKHACVDKDTEVLTPQGWQKISCITEDTLVAQWDLDGVITFIKPTKIIKVDYTGKMFNFKSTITEQQVSPGHRMVFKNRKNNKFKTVYSEDVFSKRNGDLELPIAGNYFNPNPIKVTTELMRLFTAAQADGSFRSRQRHGNELSFHFKKIRKIYRLETLLKNCNIEYTKTERKGTEEYEVDFYIGGNSCNGYSNEAFFSFIKTVNKCFGEWVLKLSYECIDAIVDESKWWDSRRNVGLKSWQYYSVNAENCEWMAIMAHLTNRRSYVTNDHPTVFTTNISETNLVSFAKTNRKVIDYIGYIYSLQVPSTYYLIRKGGKTSITGNCNYDAGPGVLAHKLQTTMKNAKELLQKSYTATPQLKLWHKRIEQELQKSRYLINLLGRKHQFAGMWNDSLLRSAYAYIPQSTVGDLLNKSLVEFYRKYSERRDIILQLHDAIYILSPLGGRKESVSLLKDCMMHELTSSHGDKYIIDVDFSAGNSWGTLEEL